MKSHLWMILALPVMALSAGCVARVETDLPASGTVNVDVDPPRRAPDVKVNVD